MTLADRIQEIENAVADAKAALGGITKETHIAICLDQSGSMGAMQDAAIQFFNDQVEELQKNHTKGGSTYVNLFLFNHAVTAQIEHGAVRDLVPLNRDTYTPHGSTAMYDCVGKAVNSLSRFENGAINQGFLVIVISDGFENASQEFTGQQIANLVTTKQNTGRWSFVYLGANQNLAEVTQHLGIVHGNMASYTATTKGMGAVSSVAVAGTSRYLANREVGVTMTNAYAGDEDNITHVDENS
jgi:hypothetical protein